MNAIKKILAGLFILFCFAGNQEISAQPVTEEEHALRITARAFPESIKLRWAPTSMYAWKESNRVGYVLERFTMRRGDEMLSLAERKDGKILTAEPLKPWTDGEQWRPLMERNSNAAIAAQALYGSSFNLTNGGNVLAAKKDEQQNRYAFGLFAADQSLEVADALGLYFEDTSVKKGEYYLYKIYPAAAAESGVPVDTGFIYVGRDEVYQLPKITEVETEFTNQLVYISWDKTIFSQFYSSYVVERSTDGQHFVEINAEPFVGLDKKERGDERMVMRDSLASNDQVYYYRVKGKTIYDEVGPPSDASDGIGQNAKVASPNITGISNNENINLGISWELPTELETEITGFQLKRSSNHQGPFSIISGETTIDKSLRYFIDASPLAVNYYQISAIDKYGRELNSFAALGQLDDATPPAAPQRVRGTIMGDGTLVLTWAENMEQDIMGYRVFLANRKERQEYVQITAKPLLQNYMTHTVKMNTLSEEVYVKVMALDYRQNTSAYSEIATIARPDSIAPAAPIFTSTKSIAEGVKLFWENSASADVVGMELQRKKSANDNWETIQQVNYPENLDIKNFVDKTTEKGAIYQYRLKAIDDVGLFTFSKRITAASIDNGIRSAVKEVVAAVDRNKKVVSLNWTYQPEGEHFSHFIIYRGDEKSRPGKYATVKKVSSELKNKGWVYEDSGLRMDTNYKYQIRAVYANGAKSPLSELVSVNF